MPAVLPCSSRPRKQIAVPAAVGDVPRGLRHMAHQRENQRERVLAGCKYLFQETPSRREEK